MEIKKIFAILRGLAVAAFLLGVFGFGSAVDQKQVPAKTAGNACVLGDNAAAVSDVQEEEQAEFFIVGCGGFL